MRLRHVAESKVGTMPPRQRRLALPNEKWAEWVIKKMGYLLQRTVTPMTAPHGMV
jgi:hypothetical protein